MPVCQRRLAGEFGNRPIARPSSAVCGLLLAAIFGFASAQAQSPATKELTNSLGMKFTGIPAGEFLMGASSEEISERKAQLTKSLEKAKGRTEQLEENLELTDSEGPQHRVTLSRGFWLGTYEVTQSEFQAVMGFNPSAFSATGARAKWMAGLDTRRHPVEKVSWEDAVEFCTQLSGVAEEAAAGRTYRLPTEAEWEYAYRAGTTTKWYWGDTVGKENKTRLDYTTLGTGKTSTVPVGSIPPNPWGLFDMTGNVHEWCADWHDAQTYTAEAVRDPAGPATGVERVYRGGKTFWFPPNLRSAARNRFAPASSNAFIGFRVICEVRPVAPAAQASAALAKIDTQLKAKGLLRQGTFFVLAEEPVFARYAATLERIRTACFVAQRERDDARAHLQWLASAKATALQARIGARGYISYSDTWREHWNGVRARRNATDALALVSLSREDAEHWLADAQADFDDALARFAEQCQSLRSLHGTLQTKQRELAADSSVQSALAAASAADKKAFRLGPSPSVAAAVKKLEHEEQALQQLQKL